MPLDFPTSPTDGQIYDNYYWDSATGVWNSLGNYAIPNLLSNATFKASSSSAVPITVQGAVSQSANLQNWKDSAGNVVASIGSGGKLNLTSALDVPYGGTGATSLTYGSYLKGNGTGSITPQTGVPTTDLTGRLSYSTVPAGTVIQVAEVRANAGDKSASTSAVDIISTTFTTRLANSKLLLMWHSGQVAMSGPQVNMTIYFTIDGTDISDFTTNHYFYGDNNTATFRHVVTIPVMSGALSLGSHTVKVRGQGYNGTATYDFQSSSSPERRSRLLIMEVAQ